jgi:hypothetical protein
VSILQSTSGVMGSLIYRKFKLPLNYSRLTEPKALAEFWSIAHGAADSIGAALSKPGWALRTRNREVCFYDTDGLTLYNNNFILRRRISFRGRNSAIQEVVLKFRHPDRHVAMGVDPRPLAEIPHIVRFKEQVLPSARDQRGMRTIFWHGCKIIKPCSLEDVRYDTFAGIFPALRHLGADPEARLTLVNDVIVDERVSEIGKLNFAEGVKAKALISLWRVKRDQRPLAAEFSFQIKYDRTQENSERTRGLLPESFYLELQSRLEGWTSADTTKAYEFYRLGQFRLELAEQAQAAC